MVEVVSIVGAWFSGALVVGILAGPALRAAGVAAEHRSGTAAPIPAGAAAGDGAPAAELTPARRG